MSQRTRPNSSRKLPCAALLAVTTAAIAAPASQAPSHAIDLEALKSGPNLSPSPAGTSGGWSLEMLLALTQRAAMAVWGRLPAPIVAEMNGHYMAMGLGADNPACQK